MIHFRNNPFVRILIPFVAGIVLSSAFDLQLNTLYPIVFSLALLIALFFINKRTVTEGNKWSYLLVADLFLLASGFYCCYAYNIRNDAGYFGHFVADKPQVWLGEIKDLPIEKENFYKVQVEVKEIEKERSVTGRVMLYIKKPFDVSVLTPGQTFRSESRFIQPKPPLNPHEFNYKRFLALKNIHYQTFVEPGNVEYLKGPTEFSLTKFGLAIKQSIKSDLETSTLNKAAAQLCVALLTGYDDEIDPETINAFAHSGTLHVLSVSGLHTGILYAVLVFVLGIVDKHKRYKWVQLILITVVLWFFVLITGFSPPVLRAVIMLNLIALGRSYYSYSSEHAINIVAVSAFLILVFSPLLIYDAGFLLSYSAVLGIICFQPWFSSWIRSKHKIVNKTWQLISVSMAAQLSTLPVTLLFFHQFPIWFMVSNLVVIPLCTVMMGLGFLVLVKLSFVAPLINVCSNMIFYCIYLTNSPGSGYIDGIDFGWKDMLFLSSIIVSVSLLVKGRNYSFAISTAVLVIFWQLSSLPEVVNKKSDSHIGIYQVNKQTVVDVKNAEALCFSSQFNSSDYNYHVLPNHTFYNYPEKRSLNTDFVASGKIKFLKIRSAEQLILMDWLEPDYLLVTCNVELMESPAFKKIKLVIADGSNKYQNIKKLKALCDKFAIPFYSTAEKGYFELSL